MERCLVDTLSWRCWEAMLLSGPTDGSSVTGEQNGLQTQCKQMHFNVEKGGLPIVG